MVGRGGLFTLHDYEQLSEDLMLAGFYLQGTFLYMSQGRLGR